MLSVDGLSFSYDTRPVLDSVSFRVGKGELCALLGNNGAGKTTLLRCVLGILRPREGVVLVSGEDASRMNRARKARRMSYVPQRETGTSRLTVFDAVLMGRKPHAAGGPGARDMDVVNEVLETLGLRELSLRCLDELSGGEAQKVLIGRALAQEPAIMLLDEPTSNLDLRNQLEVMETVSRVVAEKGIAALMAIHDVNLALRFSHKFMFLEENTVLAFGGPEVVSAGNMRKVFGVDVEIETVRDRKLVIPLAEVGLPREQAWRPGGGSISGI